MEKSKFVGEFMFFILVFFFGLVLLISFTSAIEYDISDKNVKVDKNIASKFVYSDKVYVSVLLRDDSKINFTGTKEERREQLKLQEEWFIGKMQEFIFNLDKSIFEVRRRDSFSFSGLVDEEGLERLKDMEEIAAIELNYYGFATSIDSLFNLKWYVYIFPILIIILILLIILKIKRVKYAKKK